MGTGNAGAPSSNAEWTWPTGAVGLDVGSSQGSSSYVTCAESNTAWVMESKVVSEQEFRGNRMFLLMPGKCESCGAEGKVYSELKTRAWIGSDEQVYHGVAPLQVCSKCLDGWLVAQELMT